MLVLTGNLAATVKILSATRQRLGRWKFFGGGASVKASTVIFRKISGAKTRGFRYAPCVFLRLMKRFAKREGLHTLSEINVTPMLDLCFVLLVIFMITTPLLENNTDLALPSGAGSDQPVNPEKVRTVSIDRHEAIQLDGVPVTLDGLRARMDALRSEQGADLAVVVRVDRSLNVQKLVGVMDTLRAARITKMGMVTEAAGNPP